MPRTYVIGTQERIVEVICSTNNFLILRTLEFSGNLSFNFDFVLLVADCFVIKMTNFG